MNNNPVHQKCFHDGCAWLSVHRKSRFKTVLAYLKERWSFWEKELSIPGKPEKNELEKIAKWLYVNRKTIEPKWTVEEATEKSKKAALRRSEAAQILYQNIYENLEESLQFFDEKKVTVSSLYRLYCEVFEKTEELPKFKTFQRVITPYINDFKNKLDTT